MIARTIEDMDYIISFLREINLSLCSARSNILLVSHSLNKLHESFFEIKEYEEAINVKNYIKYLLEVLQKNNSLLEFNENLLIPIETFKIKLQNKELKNE